MENHGYIFATASIDTSRTATLIENLDNVLHNFLDDVASKPYEPELVQNGELLRVPRVYECDSLNKRVHKLSSGPIQKLQRFGDHNLKLNVRQPGLLDAPYFEELHEPSQLSDDEIDKHRSESYRG
ncbi:hypothetical protein F5Y11DRAFT_78332 [Daldinia sp. FL1419]|nr:hypothetical protein F5Y11DRAFT_78332 [Daldinia sp. FL1419]